MRRWQRGMLCRVIISEMAVNNSKHVYLDVTHKPEKMLKSRFANVYRSCESYGIDLTKDLVPVLPASHYSCGGIWANQFAQTDCTNLYALGECAYSGMHGANRLGGNSMLECVVTARLSAQSIAGKCFQSRASQSDSFHGASPKEYAANFTLGDVQKIMWDYVGIVRSNDSLRKAKTLLSNFKEQLDDMDDNVIYKSSAYDLRNAVFSAYLTTLSAAARKESRGVHFNSDYPETDSIYDGKPSVLQSKSVASSQLDLDTVTQ